VTADDDDRSNRHYPTASAGEATSFHNVGPYAVRIRSCAAWSRSENKLQVGDSYGAAVDSVQARFAQQGYDVQ
jgi:hypothetical protein